MICKFLHEVKGFILLLNFCCLLLLVVFFVFFLNMCYFFGEMNVQDFNTKLVKKDHAR